MLDQAVGRIGKDVKGDLWDKMLFAVGDSFLGLGEYDKAIRAFERVVQLSSGEDKKLAIDAVTYKAIAISEQQKQIPKQDRDPEISLGLLKDVYEQKMESTAPKSPDWIRTRMWLGTQYSNAVSTYQGTNRDVPNGYIEQAIEHLEWAAKYGQYVGQYFQLQADTNLAIAHMRTGNLDKAEQIWNKTMPIWKALHQVQTSEKLKRTVRASWLKAQNGYAKTFHKQGKTEEAIKLIGDVIKEKEQFYSSVSHPSRRASIRLLLKMLNDAEHPDDLRDFIAETRQQIKDEKTRQVKTLEDELSAAYETIERDLAKFDTASTSTSKSN